MGTLRIEPKISSLTPVEARPYRDAVAEVARDHPNHEFYWNLDKDEDPRVARIHLLKAAHELNTPLVIRSLRKKPQLHLIRVSPDSEKEKVIKRNLDLNAKAPSLLEKALRVAHRVIASTPFPLAQCDAEQAMAYEFSLREIPFARSVAVPVQSDGYLVVDFLVGDRVFVLLRKESDPHMARVLASVAGITGLDQGLWLDTHQPDLEAGVRVWNHGLIEHVAVVHSRRRKRRRKHEQRHNGSTNAL